MCDPVTVGLIAAGGQAVGGGVQAFGQYQAGVAQKKVADYQASLERVRASMAEQQGMVAQTQSDKGFAQQMGRARTAEAAGGVVVDGAGSAQDYALSAAAEHAVEKFMIKQQAQQAIWGFQTQSDLLKYQGRMAKRAGVLNAAGSLLSSASQAGGSAAGAMK